QRPRPSLECSRRSRTSQSPRYASAPALVGSSSDQDRDLGLSGELRNATSRCTPHDLSLTELARASSSCRTEGCKPFIVNARVAWLPLQPHSRTPAGEE